MVAGGISCHPAEATFNCSKPQLYDMETDYAENHDLADTYPEVRFNSVTAMINPLCLSCPSLGALDCNIDLSLT